MNKKQLPKTVRIWKWEVDRYNPVSVSKNIEFLDVQEQNGKIVVWGEVDINEEQKEIQFVTIGTGLEFYQGLNYIGTVQLDHTLVVHVYYRDVPTKI